MDNESTPKIKVGMNERLQRGRARIDEFNAESKAKARRAVRITNNYAHDHPWRMVLAGSALAFVAGLVVRETMQRSRKLVNHARVKPVFKMKQSKFELIHALIPLAALGLKALSVARAHAAAKNAAEATKAPRGFA